MTERRKPYDTDTRHKVNLSGYQWAARQIEDIQTKTILDNACGTGYGSYLLSKLSKKKVIGIDISKEAIDYCKKQFRNDNLIFSVMNSETLGFKNQVFDVVISQDTIEHVPNDKLFLSEIARILKDNGELVLFTPHGKGKNRKPENIYHIREYNHYELDNLLKKFFGKIKYYGRRLDKQLKAIEATFDNIRRFDPLYLRRVIPRRIRHFLGSILSKWKVGVSLKDISLEHVEYFEGVAEDASLIAICRKPKYLPESVSQEEHIRTE